MKKIILLLFINLIISPIYSQSDYFVTTAPLESKQEIEVIHKDSELFVSENFPYLNPHEWNKGMIFYDEFEKRTLVIDSIYDSKIMIPNTFMGIKSTKPAYFMTISFTDKYVNSFIEKVVFKYSKKEISDVFNDQRNYPINTFDRNDIKENTLSIIYIGDIEKAKKLLIGKKMFILKQEWYSDSIKNAITQSKYTPITIINVGLNLSQNYPVKIIFKTNNGEEFYLNSQLSGINKDRIAFDCGDLFTNQFSFEDPKKKYPQITNAAWNLICRGKVKIGMSKVECELSWGKPKTINTTIVKNHLDEQWVYYSSYLYFENGKLRSIQN